MSPPGVAVVTVPVASPLNVPSIDTLRSVIVGRPFTVRMLNANDLVDASPGPSVNGEFPVIVTPGFTGSSMKVSVAPPPPPWLVSMLVTRSVPPIVHGTPDVCEHGGVLAHADGADAQTTAAMRATSVVRDMAVLLRAHTRRDP